VQIYQQLSSSKSLQTHFLPQRFHLSTLWLKSVKQQAEMSLSLRRQLVMTHVLEVASCRQVSASVAAAYLKIFVHLWHAPKNLVQIKRSNIRARQRVIDVVRADLSQDLTQYKIAVLGATFKPDSDDVRDSPALDIAAQLQEAGAQVVVHDPKGIEPARKRFPNLDYQEKVVDAVKGADAILHLTEWKEYRELDPSVIGQLVKSKFLIDGRNMLDRNKWRAAGWRVHALGRTD
jgi:hypothetical protein